jgi:hypothetical protein
MAPIYDDGFNPSTDGFVARAWAESDIGRIERFLDEGPEDLPRTNVEAVMRAAVILADVHEPGQATLPAARYR